jgi:putative ATPase
MDLFDYNAEKQQFKEAPLAARMRPANLAEFVGQEHIVGQGRVLRRAIDAGNLPSVVLWGPPGSGKTTLAYIMAQATNAHFTPISAVSAGVADLRRIIDEAKERRKMSGHRTILFIDEIHRFNKSQQDAILPYVEDGTVTLIGATTENPSFEVISPLLSRAQVFMLKSLSHEEIGTILTRAMEDKERGLGAFKVFLDDDAREHLITMANNDARAALNALETAAMTTPPDEKGERHINLATVEDALQQRALLYDQGGEQHYDIISALHKTIRGSDPDAALYWLARMIEAGEDPLFIIRRLIRAASEDVGMADPQALVVCMAAQQAVHFVGMPEANLALAQAAVYLATAPKSNSLYVSYGKVRQEVIKGKNEPVPVHLRNPITKLMKSLEYGKGYKYAHQFPGHFVRQQNLPDALMGKQFYQPSDQGFEKQVQARLRTWWPERYQNKGE